MTIDSLFSAFSGNKPGASVLVVRGDSVLVRTSYGMRDVEAGLAATPATNYRLASLTKAFTAMAVMQLVQEGRLTLDTPAVKVLPGFPAYAKSVTVKNLLNHTSGLWDYEDFVPDTQTYQVKDRDALRLVATRAESTYFAPGSTYRYSNTGYALLALIVEQITGGRFADVLRERIFAPAGMINTVALEEGISTVAERAYGHTVTGDSIKRTDQSNTSAVLGDGGVYSSIDDMAKWDKALRTHALIDSTLWRQAITPPHLASGNPTQYGFGWFADSLEGHPRLKHHGETRGFTNAIQRFPEDGLTIVILTNRTDSAPWDIAEKIARLYIAIP